MEDGDGPTAFLRLFHVIASEDVMGGNRDKPRSDADAEQEQEIPADRKFSLSQAIGRMAAGEEMKLASPVTASGRLRRPSRTSCSATCPTARWRMCWPAAAPC